jgi:hypothetical protein
MAVGEIGKRLGQRFAAAPDEIERRREARRDLPLDIGRRLRERGRGDAGRGGGRETREKLPAPVTHSPLVCRALIFAACDIIERRIAAP